MENKTYINPDKPVYISYSWENNDNRDIEDPVRDLCALMDENNIYYKIDKGENDQCLIEYFDSIPSSEEVLGNGEVVIMVLSRKYLVSLNCLYEMHCLFTRKDFKNHIVPVILHDAPDLDQLNISKELTYERYQQLSKVYYAGKSVMPIEEKLIKNKGYQGDFQTLSRYLNEIKFARMMEDMSLTAKVVYYSAVINKVKQLLAGKPEKEQPKIKPSIVTDKLPEELNLSADSTESEPPSAPEPPKPPTPPSAPKAPQPQPMAANGYPNNYQPYNPMSGYNPAMGAMGTPIIIQNVAEKPSFVKRVFRTGCMIWGIILSILFFFVLLGVMGGEEDTSSSSQSDSELYNKYEYSTEDGDNDYYNYEYSSDDSW